MSPRAARHELAGVLRRAAARPATPAVAAAGLGLGALAEALLRSVGDRVAVQSGVLVCLLALATTLPLAMQRRSASAAAIVAATVLSMVAFHGLTVAGALAQLIVLYRLGRGGSQLLAAAFSLPFPVVALVVDESGEARVLTLLLASLALAAAWAGAARWARAEANAHQAARQAIDGTLIEHTARGERARIVRELHDVVAHHISIIAVQAESARLTTAGMPAAGAQRLSGIGDTARTALIEMRRLLGVLREDVTADVVMRAPQPGLRQLNELLDDSRAASGTGTRLIVHGPPDRLDPGVELAAYRIVQEALTNARRHAPGAAVDVELHFADDTVLVRVRDNGPGPAAVTASGGHGLLGMRERAAAVGGELRTGRATGGGFVVEAVLPAKAEVAR